MGLHEVGGEAAAMPFKKFAQIGRVVYLNEGPYKGKLAVIIDIIDTNRALIDGPCHGVPRQEYKFCEMQLTSYILKIARGQRSKQIRMAWKLAKVTEQFASSQWAKNIKKGQLRRKMTDLERFKLGRAKQTRNKIVGLAVIKMKSQILKAKKDKRAKLAGQLVRKPYPKKGEKAPKGVMDAKTKEAKDAKDVKTKAANAAKLAKVKPKAKKPKIPKEPKDPRAKMAKAFREAMKGKNPKDPKARLAARHAAKKVGALPPKKPSVPKARGT